jgi:hypothetical protein
MQFDDPVYRQILGLPAAAPLADWYDLLGVPRGESRESALQQAMLGRIAQVRRYQLGAYQSQALELINELSQAYVCLSDAGSRLAYDAGQVVEAEAAEPGGLARMPVSPATPLRSGKPPPESRQPLESQPRPKPVAAGVCPQCGKPMPAQGSVCYHCGFRSAAKPDRTGEGQAATRMLAFGCDELLRQDLSPEQILARLRLMRESQKASNLGGSHWTRPTMSVANSSGHAQSFCQSCRRPLMNRSDAYGIRNNELASMVDYISEFAKKLEALGQQKFTWPLGKKDLLRARDRIPARDSTSVRLYCQRCYERLAKSERLGAG